MTTLQRCVDCMLFYKLFFFSVFTGVYVLFEVLAYYIFRRVGFGQYATGCQDCDQLSGIIYSYVIFVEYAFVSQLRNEERERNILQATYRGIRECMDNHSNQSLIRVLVCKLIHLWSFQ